MAVGPDQNEWDFGLEGGLDDEAAHGLDRLYTEDTRGQAEDY